MGAMRAWQQTCCLQQWGRENLIDASETRNAYIAALRAADNHDIKPLLEFVRS